MAKIVYNACHGGFSLSEAGMVRYAEIKGIKLYPERDKRYQSLEIATYWTVPPEERVKPLDGDAWYAASMDERQAHNQAYDRQTLSNRNFDRTDPALVQAVEELGDRANGKYADLKIAEVSSGSSYRIDEYDGAESVMTPDDYEWEVAP